MKRRTCAVLALLLGAAICGICEVLARAENLPAAVVLAEELSDYTLDLYEANQSYTLEQAKADGYVVFEDLDITAGWDVWDAFLAKTEAGEPAVVRLGYYYGPLDPADYGSEYYEEIKDDYPVLYVEELVYDGEEYTLIGYDGEETEPHTSAYRYLIRYESDPPSMGASYSHLVCYILVDEPNYTYEELWWSRLSPDFSDAIDYRTVYHDYTYKDESLNEAHKRPV